MNSSNNFFAAGLAVFSGLVSFVFVYYALGVLNTPQAPQWDRVFAYVAIGYGLGNLYILSAAWRFKGNWSLWAHKLIALCFFGVFAIDLWRSGIRTGYELIGGLGMAAVLWLNWYAVKRLTLLGNDQDPDIQRIHSKPKKPKGKNSR